MLHKQAGIRTLGASRTRTQKAVLTQIDITCGADDGVVHTAIAPPNLLYSWFTNNRLAHSSVTLLHGSIDGTATYVQVLADRGVISNDATTFSTGIGTLVTAVVAAVVISALTRGKLSYCRYQSGAERFDLAGTIAPASGDPGMQESRKVVTMRGCDVLRVSLPRALPCLRSARPGW